MNERDYLRLIYILNSYGAEHYKIADPAYTEFCKFRERILSNIKERV